ncbi:Clp protease ClpP [Dysgonomonas termitidis]|uniref:ATP-dependent Clp protease proteolytic subunit n=1 Tax=Dysgonomonas termitidis TaxID=1516126 RepID=A0ABV9KR55_9BACT
MDINSLKHVVGKANTGETAAIRFFGKITEESAGRFNNEFDFLENAIRPSLIRVLINSEGGSVLHGMSIYSTIRNSTVPTECVIEGMAASMGSVVWAAGDKSFMRDYSILMIHNPFLPAEEGEDMSDMVQAFTKQITTIYRKRFGLKKEHVEAIMNGEAGRDGTFFDSPAAVKAGIIPAGNVLHTSKQLCDKVKNELPEPAKAEEIQLLMSRICMEAPAIDDKNKHSPEISPSLIQIYKNDTMTEENNKSPEYTAVTASLGMKDKFEIGDVVARISELMSVEARLTEAKKELSDAQTVIAGKEAAIRNLQKTNDELGTALDGYKAKEAEEVNAKIEVLIETAVTEGKIDKAAKAQWVEMAASNFQLAESTLASIPAREQITKEIAKDPANIQAATDAAKTAGEKIAEKVSAVIGENFRFKTLR